MEVNIMDTDDVCTDCNGVGLRLIPSSCASREMGAKRINRRVKKRLIGKDYSKI
jgi:hypothetical protein